MAARAAALAWAAAAAGCASLPEGYGGLKAGGGQVAAFHCRHEDGDDAGMAYFDLRRGLAMMELSIGIDLTGRMLPGGPNWVGEVHFGSARVVFSIPPSGGPSEVTMYPGEDAELGGDGARPGPLRRVGMCEPVAPGPDVQEALESIGGAK